MLDNLLRELYPSVREQERKSALAVREPGIVQVENYIPSGAPPSVLSGTSLSMSSAVNNGLAKNSWLYAAVTVKARAAAQVPFILQRRGQKGWMTESAHPLAVLLDRPNPYMTFQDVLERAVMHLELAGNALFYRNKAASDGRLLEIWPIDPSVISPIRGRGNTYFDRGYQMINARGERVELPPDRVIHCMYQNPADVRWGLAPVRAAALATETDISAQRWNKAVLDGGARPVAALLMDTELTEEQQEFAYEMVKSQTSGAGNARNVMVFGGISKLESFGFSPTDLDFLTGRKFSRDEICAVIGVPSILVAQGQDATFANMDAAQRHFWNERLSPLISDIARTIQDALLADFGLDPAKWRIIPDYSGISGMQENQLDRAKAEQTMAAAAMTYAKAGFSLESIIDHLGLQLLTPAQQRAADALKSLSPPARDHLEKKHGIDLDTLTPTDTVQFLQRVKQEIGGEE